MKMGYKVSTEALDIIKVCEDWYCNRAIEDFHKRKNLNQKEVNLHRMNMAKRCCSDDANLCEIISVVPEHDEKAQKFIEQLFKGNRFENQYRKQLEKVSATGTAGAYIYLQGATYLEHDEESVKAKGGKIRIDYVDADCILPLTIENDIVTECAFCGTNRVKGKEITTLVIFVLEDGLYTAETVLFDAYGRKLDDGGMLQLGEVKPFSVLTNAEVNNLDDMEGYGFPKVYNSIALFKAIDLCYNILYGDLDKGEKLVFINELLSCFKRSKEGTHQLTAQQKDLFILLGEKLPKQDSIIKEYNPEIRIEQITKCFELVLSLLSMSFGYGTKKYTFENGKITTATEYIGEKQDSMQELNKQRKNASDYISDIIHAAMWFSNQFHGTGFNVEEEISIEFDDSYIEDKTAKLEQMRADALSFPEIPVLTIWYLMEKYNISEDEAKRYVEGMRDGIVDDDEIIRKDMEKNTETKIGGNMLNGAQTQSLIAIMGQFTSGSITEGQAINLISQAIGISKTEARAILNGDVEE